MDKSSIFGAVILNLHRHGFGFVWGSEGHAHPSKILCGCSKHRGKLKSLMGVFATELTTQKIWVKDDVTSIENHHSFTIVDSCLYMFTKFFECLNMHHLLQKVTFKFPV